MPITRETFEEYRKNNQIILTHPFTKIPACEKGEYNKLSNTCWAARFNCNQEIGLKLGFDSSPMNSRQSLFTGGVYTHQWRIVLEADTPEGKENLEAFRARHKATGLRFDSDEYPHYLFEVPDGHRLIGVKTHNGFEVLQNKCMLAPSVTTDKGKPHRRIWKDDHETRFINGDIPILPESAIEELALSTTRTVHASSYGWPIVGAEAHSEWLSQLNFTHEGDNRWKRPGSNKHSLQLDYHEVGCVYVATTVLVDTKGDEIRQGLHNSAWLCHALTGKSLSEVCEYFQVPMPSFGAPAFRIEAGIGGDIVLLVSDLKLLRQNGEARKKPGFTITVYDDGVIQGTPIAKLSTAEDNRKKFIQLTHDIFAARSEEDYAGDAFGEICERVLELAAEAEEDREVALQYGAAEERSPNSMSLALQRDVVNHIRKTITSRCWRDKHLKLSDGGVWYVEIDDRKMDTTIRNVITSPIPGSDEPPLASSRTGMVREVDKELLSKNRLDDEYQLSLPYDFKNNRPLTTAVAFKDKIVDLATDEVLDPEGLLFLGGIPYTYDEVMSADCSVIVGGMDDWFGAELQDEVDTRRRLLQMCWGLTQIALKPQTIFWFWGTGGTAKTTLADATCILLPRSRVKDKTGWGSLTGKFAYAGIANARLVYFQEMGAGCTQEAIAVMKAIIGETFVEIDTKYEAQVDCRLNCYGIASSNHPSPNDPALNSRVNDLMCMHIIRGTDDEDTEWVDNNLMQGLVPIPGMYRMAIEGVQDYLNNNRQFPVPDARENAIRKVDHAIQCTLDDKLRHVKDTSAEVKLTRLIELMEVGGLTVDKLAKVLTKQGKTVARAEGGKSGALALTGWREATDKDQWGRNAPLFMIDDEDF